ncbi:hypothetical protein BKH41_02540 [Helicobacter sp. 12S02232-10]|uniref:hypothetical protein n=1 Tax=Helicobacter sp. 12S02232-10 TaxID=1476197 RepID=UPI000BA70A0B|nr:hypothetical protein [Helicobacter sp. 12S02232-10]PAF49561.1 hypothetical protein BKH41_02540 [Helicobacter sp. 12S02232-10]
MDNKSLMRGAYIFLSALIVFLGIVYIVMNTLRHNETELDRISNSHLKFQSLLDARSILEMARLCLQKYGVQACDFDEFMLGDSLGGYHLMEDKNGDYWIDIYVERKNLRTSQILRNRIKVLWESKNDQ